MALFKYASHINFKQISNSEAMFLNLLIMLFMEKLFEIPLNNIGSNFGNHWSDCKIIRF